MINGPQAHVDAIERERGFLEGFSHAGIHALVKRYGDFPIQSGFLAMKSILEELAPDALFCSNEMVAGAIKPRLVERRSHAPRLCVKIPIKGL